MSRRTDQRGSGLAGQAQQRGAHGTARALGAAGRGAGCLSRLIAHGLIVFYVGAAIVVGIVALIGWLS